MLAVEMVFRAICGPRAFSYYRTNRGINQSPSSKS